MPGGHVIESRQSHRFPGRRNSTETQQLSVPINLTFHGAAGCVTGSAYHLRTSRASVLIDFGLFQGFSPKKSQTFCNDGENPVL